MPIFDYKCNYCGLIKEVIVYKTELQEPLCPECEQKMEKLLSSPGLLRTNFHDKASVKARKKNAENAVVLNKQTVNTPGGQIEATTAIVPNKG